MEETYLEAISNNKVSKRNTIMTSIHNQWSAELKIGTSIQICCRDFMTGTDVSSLCYLNVTISKME